MLVAYLCAVSGLLVIAFIFICYVWFMLDAYLCAVSGLLVIAFIFICYVWFMLVAYYVLCLVYW